MSTKRPQPVLAAAQVSALATVLTALAVGLLARRGILVPDAVAQPLADLVGVGIVAGVGALGSLWAALQARARVTPLEDPRDAGGVLLQPAEPAPQRDDEPPTEEIPVVDIAALRREYRLD